MRQSPNYGVQTTWILLTTGMHDHIQKAMRIREKNLSFGYGINVFGGTIPLKRKTPNREDFR